MDLRAGQSGAAGFMRALQIRPAGYKAGRPVLKRAARFKTGQVRNRAVTYITRKGSFCANTLRIWQLGPWMLSVYALEVLKQRHGMCECC